MRTVTYGAACSLDGFITGPGGALDWLHWSDDARAVMEAYWPTVDTVLMGRKTWEVSAASGGSGGGGEGGIRSIIVSRTLPTAPPGTELVRDDPGGFVRRLKAEPGRGICILGGGELGTSLLAAGVVDEVGLNIHPVVLGSGARLFGAMERRIALELAESRVLDGGCVLATYRVRES